MNPTTVHSIIRFSSVLTLLILLPASPLFAQTTTPGEEDRLRMNEQIEAFMDRLDLTGAQREVVRPIMKEAIAQRLAVLEKYDIDPATLNADNRPGYRTMRKLSKDMENVRKATEEQLRDVLTDEQMTIWQQMEEERREQMRARLRGRG